MPHEPVPSPAPQNIEYRRNLPPARIAKSGIARLAFWAALGCAGMVWTIMSSPRADGWIVPAVLAGIPILLGIAGLRDAHRSRVRGLRSSAIGIIIGLCCIPAVFSMAQRPARRALAYTIACKANLRALGQSLATYVATYGQWPETLADLPRFSGHVVSPLMMTCPSADADELPTYLYIRPAMTSPSPATIVLIEPPRHRDHTLMNVLYSDGSVNEFRDEIARRTFAELAPPSPQTRPATTTQ